MKTSKVGLEKKAYRSPQLEQIILDKEISLALSSPAELPIWSMNIEEFRNDPLLTNLE